MSNERAVRRHRGAGAVIVAVLALSLLTGCSTDAGAAGRLRAQPAAVAEPAVAAEQVALDPPPADTAAPVDEVPAPAPAADPAAPRKPAPLARTVTAGWTAGSTALHGDRGPTVLALQRRLSQLGYDPGRQDSSFGMQTRQALWAFQHVNGLPATGDVDQVTSRALLTPLAPAALAADSAPDRVEVNIAKQYAVVYLHGRVRLVTHISSGSGRRWCEKDLTGKLRCASGGTPRGRFRVHGEIRGWRTSYLGKLYQPAYFKGGYALHGSLSVPNGPASHGCVRIPMHVAGYLIDLTEIGMPVIVV